HSSVSSYFTLCCAIFSSCSRLLLLSSFTSTPPPEIYTLSLHDALPISKAGRKDQVEWVEKVGRPARDRRDGVLHAVTFTACNTRSEEHTSELLSRFDLVCRLLLEKKKKYKRQLQLYYKCNILCF